MGGLVGSCSNRYPVTPCSARGAEQTRNFCRLWRLRGTTRKFCVSSAFCSASVLRPCAKHKVPGPCEWMVSGSISLPSPGCFSPFPHGTSSLSVCGRYLALESSLPCFPQGYPHLVVLGSKEQRVFSLLPTGLSPSLAALSRVIRLERKFLTLRGFLLPLYPTTPRQNMFWRGLGSSPFARRY